MDPARDIRDGRGVHDPRPGRPGHR
jgi:hypothetical protein